MAFALRSIENLEAIMEKPINSIILRKNMKIFIDIRSYKGKLEQLDSNLRKLKIMREEFLTKEVNFIVCHKHNNLMDTSIGGKLGLSILSRGHALLQRSNSASTVNNLTDPHKFAETWKIPIIMPDEFNRLIKSALLLKEKNNCLKNRNLIRHFNKAFIKFEDVEKKLTPVFKCFDQFPEISFLKRYNAKSLLKFNLKYNDQLNFEREVGLDGIVKKTKKQKCISKYDKSVILSHEYNQKVEKMNYCECCERLFDEELIEHIVSAHHKKFVQIDENFITLDKIIHSLPIITDLYHDNWSIVKLDKANVNFLNDNNFFDLSTPYFDNNLILKDETNQFNTIETNKSNYLTSFISPTLILQELFNPINKLSDHANRIINKNNIFSDYNKLNEAKNTNSLIMSTNSDIYDDFLKNKLSLNINSPVNISFSNRLCKSNIIEGFHASVKSILPLNLELTSLGEKSLENKCNRINEDLIFRYDQFDNANNTSVSEKNIIEDLISQDVSSSFVSVSQIFSNVSKLLNGCNSQIFSQRDQDTLPIDDECTAKEYFESYIGCRQNSAPLEASSLNTFESSSIHQPYCKLSDLKNSSDLPLQSVFTIPMNVSDIESPSNFMYAKRLQQQELNLLNTLRTKSDNLHPIDGSSNLDIESLIDISNDRLSKMNETIHALWTSTYITDLKIKLSKIQN